VAEWLTVLTAGGLLDQDGDRFRPHNWAKRQFVSDRDATAAERKRRERDKKRVTVDVTRDSHGEVTDKSQPPEQIQNRTDVADAGDAGARQEKKALIGPEALKLAEQLLIIAGHDPGFWPPGWCGAPLRVQFWLNQGWPAEIILAAVKSAAGRKRGDPAASVQFFEKAVAEEVARQSAPVPKVQISEAETITVNHGTSKSRSGGSLLDAIRREQANVEAQIADLALPGNAVLSISDRSVRRS
jgi:hypothetical protein